MSCCRAIQGYVSKMINVPGMKALLLDAETTTMISMVYAQSQIIQQEVFLVERIDRNALPAWEDDGKSESKRNAGGDVRGGDDDDDEDDDGYDDDSDDGDERKSGGKKGKKKKKKKEADMHHLKAVCYIRPTPASVAALVRHLGRPKYKEYHLFFSNAVTEDVLRRVAEADEYEVVRQVQEYYADFYAITPELFHLNLPAVRSLSQPELYWQPQEQRVFRRTVEGVLAALLAHKRRPVVRYAKGSELARKTALELSRRMDAESRLFHFNQGAVAPVLLVLDRRDDPVTPLLLQWTYQAMVHEILGISNNRVDMRNVPGVRKDNREVVLSADQDKFFRGAMHLNFGDLGASIKTLVEDYQRKMKVNQNINTLEEMTRFVENYPQFRAMSGNVSKHVAVVTELSRVVEKRDLMAVSEVEQELACQQGHAAALEKTLRLLEDNRLSNDDRLRVVLLYALRYETSKNQLQQLKSLLRDRATTEQARMRVRAVDALLQYAGAQQRGGELFGKAGLLNRFAEMVAGPLKGIENIYTQHRPKLAEHLDLLVKGKLKTSEFPFVRGGGGGGGGEVPREVFVFVVGGVTFEEAAAVSKLNAAAGPVRVTLGGTFVHNSSSFLDDVLGVVEQKRQKARDKKKK